MRIIEIDGGYRSPCDTVVALGNFDGVHIGHASLLRAAYSASRELGALPAALTFDPDPANVVEGGCVSPVLTGTEEKAYQMARLGVGALFVKSFDKTVMRMEPARFVRDVLAGPLRCVFAVCGFHYRFGGGGEGDAGLLKSLCGELGIKTLVMEPVMAKGQLVSASSIRALLMEGRPEEAAALLGRPYSVNFPVVEGKRLGRELGFPTVNQNFPPCHIVPKRGVYASRALVGGTWRVAVSNIGRRPTVESARRVNMETHIIGCDDELYGERVRVALHGYIRAESRFADENALRLAIAGDVAAAKAYFSAKNADLPA